MLSRWHFLRWFPWLADFVLEKAGRILLGLPISKQRKIHTSSFFRRRRSDTFVPEEALASSLRVIYLFGAGDWSQEWFTKGLHPQLFFVVVLKQGLPTLTRLASNLRSSGPSLPSSRDYRRAHVLGSSWSFSVILRERLLFSSSVTFRKRFTNDIRGPGRNEPC